MTVCNKVYVFEHGGVREKINDEELFMDNDYVD